MKKESYKRLTIVTIYAIAMGFIETLIVIYLRMLYYPNGFAFPLVPKIDTFVLNIEWIREAFTIVMLATVAILAGKTFYEKFGYFLYTFAIWDIFYYIWLKVLLDWPKSFLTWDLLFLIPIPWAGPVLAPLILSITMASLCLTIIYLQDKGKNVLLTIREWSLLAIGSIIVLYTFFYDYGKLIIQGGFLPKFFNLATNTSFQKLVGAYVPTNYNWMIFTIGETMLLSAIISLYLRMNKR